VVKLRGINGECLLTITPDVTGLAAFGAVRFLRLRLTKIKTLQYEKARVLFVLQRQGTQI
jgi:hypothetical protein